MTMTGRKLLVTKCPKCGLPLSVLTRQRRPSPDRPGERVEEPIGKPICPVGHLYRTAPGEPFPE
jgi:hypothetical protein